MGGNHKIYLQKFIASLFILFLFSSFIICAQGAEQSVEEQPEEKRFIETDETKIFLNTETPQDNNQTGRGATNTIWLFLEMVFVLAIVVAIIYLLFRLLKKNTNIGSFSEDEFLHSVSYLSLGGNKSIQVVTLVDHAYLIGVSENNINLISEIDDKELINAMNLYAEKHSGMKRPTSFQDVLQLFMPQKSKKSAFEDGASKQILDSLGKQSKRLKNIEEDNQ